MKISELIRPLQTILDKHGDIEVLVEVPNTGDTHIDGVTICKSFRDEYEVTLSLNASSRQHVQFGF